MNAIVIRHIEARDAAAVHAIYSEAQGFGDTLQLPYPALTMWEKRLSATADGHYGLVAEWQGEVVGQLGLDVNRRPRRQHVADLGIGVAASARRKGVGEALLKAAIELAENWLQVRRIEIQVYVDNVAGIALYRKLGFEVEGTGRDYAFRDGRFCDVLFMARVRAQGPGQRAQKARD